MNAPLKDLLKIKKTISWMRRDSLDPLECNSDGQSDFLNEKTARKMSNFEKMMLESEEKFNALAQAIQAMVWITDPNGEVLVMSTAWQKFTGQSEVDAKGNGWTSMLHPDDTSISHSIWKQAVTSKTPYITKYRLYCAIDEKYHNTYSKGFPVFFSDGQLKEWIGVTMDIDSIYHYKGESDFIRQQFECLSNSLGHLMWYAEESGKLQFLNTCCEELLGYPREQLLEYGWRHYLQASDVDRCDQIFEEVIKSNSEMFEGVFGIICENGSVKQLLIRSHRIRMPEINLNGWMGSGVDVTEITQIEDQLKNFNSDLESTVNERTELLEEKKRELEQKLNEKREAEEILEESVNRYKTLSNISPVGIFHIDLSGEITYCNDYLLEMLGVKEFVEVKGKHWIDFISEEERLKVMKVWHEFTMKREEQSFHMEFRMKIEKCNVCHEYWVLCQIVKQKSETVTRMSFSGTMTNMTERKRLEKEKLEAMEKSNEVQERRWKEVERNIGLQDEFIDFMVHEIRNPLSIITLTSEMVQTQLDNLMSDVEQEEKEKSESIKVKEWINKNAKMKAKYEIFLKGMKEVMKNVDECATHERIICEDVLTYSKMEAGMLELEIVKCDAKEVMQNAVSLINKTTDFSNLICTCCTTDKIDVLADKISLQRVFKILLEYCCRNAKQNTVHFHLNTNESQTDSQKKICYFEFFYKGGNVMSVEDIESATNLINYNIQKPQTIQHTKTKTKYISYQYTMSGLGLVVCCNLLKLMKGTLQVHSNEMDGTKFSVLLPSPSGEQELLLAKQIKSSTQAKNFEKSKSVNPSKEWVNTSAAISSSTTINTSSPAISQSSNACQEESVLENPAQTVKILIAEDNAVNAKIVSYFLSLKGYESEIVYNGLEALNKFVDSIHGKEEKSLSGDEVKKSEYDLILMDLEMPVMNGMESCKQIRKKEEEMGIKSNERIAIIALTGHFEPNMKKRVNDIGMDNILVKPFKREDLYSLVETILRHRVE